jgi:aldehyde:ferredoxin oxidoreductase
VNKFGYAGTILEVDLSQGRAEKIPTDDYADRFIGGRGLAAKLYWDKVLPQTKAFDADNCLIFATGPLAGFTRLAASRWTLCGKSPAMEPQWFSFCSAGGSWGVWLKFAGYDAITIQGKSDKLVYLFLHDGLAEIKDASFLLGKNAAEARELLKAELGKEVRVVACSAAGENLVSFSGVLADEDSHGASGFGAVMGAKKLKAIAVVGNQRPTAAHPDRLSKLADYFYQLRTQTTLGKCPWWHEGRTKRRGCWGCIGSCDRLFYKTDDGRRVKFFCQFGDMYQTAAMKYYGSWNEVVVHAADLCHKNALDSFVMEPMIAWLAKCYQEGVLSEEETGLPLSKIGSPEFIETLVRKISLREGFGDILAQGTIKAAELIGKRAKELIGDSIATRANDLTMYDPRLYITTALLYAIEPRKPMSMLHDVIHLLHQWVDRAGKHPENVSLEDTYVVAEKFFGGRAAADFSTYEGKALAAKKIQDRVYAKESLILCDFMWPILWTYDTEYHVGDPTLESQIFSAVTGRETDEEGLNKLGERICNLNRAVRLREGWGGRQGDRLLDAFYEIPLDKERSNPDALLPGKEGKIISRKGVVLEMEKFENLKSEYYKLRGWDVTNGLLTSNKLEEVGLMDLADDLRKRGLLK